MNSERSRYLPITGKIYSFTTISNPDDAPEKFRKQVPYSVALIDLDNGNRITAMLTDLEFTYSKQVVHGEERFIKKYDIKIGMPVEHVTRVLMVDGDEDRGEIIYGYKFRPLLHPEKH
jgi:uncharacterized OB-fold protein